MRLWRHQEIMHKDRITPYAAVTSIEAEKVAEARPYMDQLGIIFNRPQKMFYMKREDDTLIKRVMVLTPSGWQVVPTDPAEYPEFVENYLQ